MNGWLNGWMDDGVRACMYTVLLECSSVYMHACVEFCKLEVCVLKVSESFCYFVVSVSRSSTFKTLLCYCLFGR